MADRDWDLVKGLVIGGLIGAAIGILFAPKSGKETREDLANKADELMAKAKEEYAKAAEKSKEVYEKAMIHLKDAEGVAREKMEEITGTLTDNKSRLKKAFEAGVDAYREEKSKTSV